MTSGYCISFADTCKPDWHHYPEKRRDTTALLSNVLLDELGKELHVFSPYSLPSITQLNTEAVLSDTTGS